MRQDCTVTNAGVRRPGYKSWGQAGLLCHSRSPDEVGQVAYDGSEDEECIEG